jgi:hypothetical protein
VTILLVGLVIIFNILPRYLVLASSFLLFLATQVSSSVKQLWYTSAPPLRLPRWDRYDVMIVLLIAISAFAIRVALIPHTTWWINADDYMVGVVSLRMLEGDFVLYYDRTGTLASVLAVPILAIGGATLPTLLLVPALLTALIAVALYGIGRDLVSRWGAIAAAAWMVVPPATPMYWSTKIQPGYWESLACATLALWGTIRLMGRWSGNTPQVWLAAGIGLSTAGALWAGLVSISLLFTCGGVALIARQRLRELPLAAWSLLVGMPVLLWLVPLLIYAVQHPDRNPLWWILYGSSSEVNALAALWGFVTVQFPLVMGVVRPEGRAPVEEYIGYLLIGMVCLAVLTAGWRMLVQADRRASVPLMLAVVTLGIFLFSKFGTLLTDVRYVLPLYIAIPLLFAILLDSVCRLRYARLGASILMVSLLFPNLISSFADLNVTKPYEARHEAVLAQVLDQHNIRYVYASYWVGMGIMFESNNTITASSLLGPTKYSYNPGNEQRVLEAAGANTAFAFLTHGVSTLDFENHLQMHDIHCTEVEVGTYRLYLDCTPFPERTQILRLSRNLPEALQ